MCLLVISITIFILTFFFYQKYTDVLYRNLYDGQEKDLEKSGRTMSDLTGEIFQLYNTVILDAFAHFRPVLLSAGPAAL